MPHVSFTPVIVEEKDDVSFLLHIYPGITNRGSVSRWKQLGNF